jgi:TRAP-type C4-dicarboxylate transport system permease small subunit
MQSPSHFILRWLKAGADHVQVLMMATMFVSFILQIVFRYFLNMPVAWTEELCVITWLWGILWGASFVMSNQDDIRFDVLISHVSRPVKRWMTVVASLAAIVILLLSLPASWNYVRFMKVESSAALGIRMDHFFSIYIAFVVATVVRQGWVLTQALGNKLYDDQAPAVENTL